MSVLSPCLEKKKKKEVGILGIDFEHLLV